MAEENRKLIDLAARISDGSDVDWNEAMREAENEAEVKVLRNLRLVHDVARIHRSGDANELTPAEAIAMTSSIDPASLGSTSSPDGEATILAEPRRSWAHLEIRDRVGGGAYGEVYRAWDPNLEREVALKLLREEPSARDELATSVLREGRLLARVRHPNVVTVHGAESHDGRVGLWMEFVPGRSLDDRLRDEGTLSAHEAALIGIDLCRALAAVHHAGLVHRDVKAQNVMREEGGRIVLMDFGAGEDLHAADDAARRRISGTPLYIAPEIYAGGAATAQSDLYSLGVLLYYLVAGTFPARGDSIEALRELHRQRRTRRLRDERPDLQTSFVRVVERALEPDPGRRYATAGELEAALATVLETVSATSPDRPSRSRFARVTALAALLLVAVLAVGGIQLGWWGGAAGYHVDADLVRVGALGRVERLEAGAQLVLGDLLSLDYRASRSLHVYIVNEDEAGNIWALFPLPDFDLQNPLPADETLRLPGIRAGTDVQWEVDSYGGREHLIVVASPEPLTEFEAEMSKLPVPGRGGMAVPVPEEGKRLLLRGLGGLASTPQPRHGTSTGRLFEMAREMARPAESVEGVFVREIELDNPKPAP